MSNTPVTPSTSINKKRSSLPFSIKRKKKNSSSQIDFDPLLLVTTDVTLGKKNEQCQQQHEQKTVYHYLPSKTASESHIKLLDKEEQIKSLEEDLIKVQRDLDFTRHRYRLKENEMNAFEKEIKETYAKEKNELELEFNVFKQAHIDKIQTLTCAIEKLYKLNLLYRYHLKKNQIVIQEEEEQEAITADDFRLSHIIPSEEPFTSSNNVHLNSKMTQDMEKVFKTVFQQLQPQQQQQDAKRRALLWSNLFVSV
ncbi:hypothetical protein BDF20DRAFT_890339 [Mycotypha africana]|uniref:uncharacterized protein n=1 Tax=Mycotypha africana TaxID=64632 RepID=UPI002300651B|nr:uncharacterized protein BDF20DRAFT_890339 [Mycotypha africana]KAI8970286.1 hypothetical protein BDF20DRAFT_890339 [Mycotypha africana]